MEVLKVILKGIHKSLIIIHKGIHKSSTIIHKGIQTIILKGIFIRRTKIQTPQIHITTVIIQT